MAAICSCGVQRPLNGPWQDPIPSSPQVDIGSIPKPPYALKIEDFVFYEEPEILTDAQRRLHSDVEFLSSGACDGREFGTRGCVEASRHIYRKMQETGLNPRIQTFRCNERIGRNIIGEIPGTGKDFIILMSYYDGIGNINGNFYPGADSNASGIAALLEIARRLSDGGRCSIVVAALDAHYRNLSGAQALSKEYSGRSPLAVINLDMLGSTLSPAYRLRKDYILCLGGRQFSNKLYDANNESGLGLHLTFDYYGSSDFTNLFYRKVSDHKVFLEKGVPCLMFTSGITFNTNKDSDTCGTLNYVIMERRVEFVTRFIRSL